MQSGKHATRPGATGGDDGHRTQKGVLMRRVRRFHRNEDGSLIIFGLFIFVLMITIAGMSMDIERFETARTKLQNTADGAALSAASLTQSVDPEVLVADYFAKAGVGSFVDDVRVSEAINYKHVEIDAALMVPTHFFNLATGMREGTKVSGLGTLVSATAEESIGDVEISLVLDISGSMRSNSKLTNLKTAAGEFVDAIYGNADSDSVSVSIVPYSTQVSAGETILSYYNRSPISHEYSHCLNFEDADFNTPAISMTDPVEQTLHFDPWTNENASFTPGNNLPDVPCPTANRNWLDILPFEDSITKLKNYVNGFTATDWTSIELGVKWGAAMLDPSFRPVVNGLIAAGTVNSGFAGRPLDYQQADGMKVMVVMTDGENTEQYEMENPYRTGSSYVYAYENNGTVYLSIWDGEGEPDPNVQTQTHTETRTERVCADWRSWYGWQYCARYEYQTITEEVEVEVQNWYRANGSSTGYASTPTGGSNAVVLTWDQLWNVVPVEYFTDKYLARMTDMYNERVAIKNARHYIADGTKDERTRAICAAAKAQGVYIYTIGFEAPYNSKILLQNCATTPSHYFDVSGTQISSAFSAIAADINRLRLIH